MANFYFTYGSEKPDVCPFQGGWTVVNARSLSEAIDKFNAKHGLAADGFGRYSIAYSAEEFSKTSMFSMGDNLGAGCHEVIE